MFRASVKFALSAVLALSLLTPAFGQKTKSQLTTEVETTFPDQTTGQITPSGVRAFQNDMINSIMPTAPVGNNNFAAFDGTTGLLKDSGISPSGQFVANANIIPGASNTVKGSTDGASASDIAVPNCSSALTFDATSHVFGCATQAPGVIPSTATVTISNGSPGVITWSSHGLTANTPVYFCTSGTLPTGLTACVPGTGTIAANTYQSNPTLYYVVGSSISTNTFTVATSIANANAGIAVNTSSAGSGTHTAFANAMACAGCIGEMVWQTVNPGSPVAATTGTSTIWNSISLTAGVWEVWGNAGVIGTGGTTVCSHLHASINYGLSGISSVPYNSPTAAHITSNNPNCWITANTPDQIVLTGTTTINGVALPDFTGGTAGLYGRIIARRTR